MDISVSIECEDWNVVADVEGTAIAAAVAALRSQHNDDGDCELSIVLADDARVTELNQRWRNKSGATNVLSFPVAETVATGDDEPRFIGDIILASGAVTKEATLLGKPLATHLSHLIVHGVLHLLGYDHPDEESAKRMHAAETAALALIGLPDPYMEYETAATA